MVQFKMRILHLWMLGFFVVLPVSAAAAELRIPDVQFGQRNILEVPVIVDRAERLSAVKMALWYDQDLFAFKKVIKAAEAKSLLHAVNHRTPGILVVAMAGARGVRAENLKVITLVFELKPHAADQTPIPFMVRESRLVDEELKNIDHSVSVGKILQHRTNDR